VALVDQSLDRDCDVDEACKFLKIGLLCTQDAPKLRPVMSTVVKMLTGEISIDETKITAPGLISDLSDLKVRDSQDDKPNAETASFDPNTFSSTDSVKNSTFSSRESTGATFNFIPVYERSV